MSFAYGNGSGKQFSVKFSDFDIAKYYKMEKAMIKYFILFEIYVHIRSERYVAGRYEEHE